MMFKFYLAQLVEGLILKGRLTPQAAGRPPMRLGLRPGMPLEALTKQLQVAWRSAVVLAALLSPRTPLQQGGGTAPPLFR